jgi:hypothetical protein
MKSRSAWVMLRWLCIALMTKIAQAGPPQPVIKLPPHPAVSSPSAAPDPTQELDPQMGRKLTPGSRACLGDGTGFVRARIRGALNVDVNWKDAQLLCGGEARSDGSGLRMSFAGPGPDGKVLRLVFGVAAAREGAPGHELPTNLTVLVDGGRIFATRGEDKCTMDELTQHPLPAKGGVRAWRIEARGFCVQPANAITGVGRILMSRFDFAGRIEFSSRSHPSP